MIRTPEARRRIIPKTESGYKLRAAMVAVAAGLVAGLLLAVAVFVLLELVIGNAVQTTLVHLMLAFAALLMFTASPLLLIAARRTIVEGTQGRYAEFSSDIGSWFLFGSLLAYVIVALPALVIVLVDIFSI